MIRKNEALEKLWSQRLEEFDASAVTQVEYCRANSLTKGQFDYWRRKLMREAPQETKLVAVQMAQFLERAPDQPKDSGLRIVINDLKLEIMQEFDTQSLRRIIDALRGQ